MNSIVDHYNEIWREDFIPPYLTSLFPLIESLNLSSDDKVLDIACGNGVLGNHLIKKFKCQLYGTDISKNALAHCAKIGYKTELVDLDSDELPFPNDSFDLILLSAMLEHVMEPEKIVQMAFQKLNSQGQMIILMPNIVWFVNRILFLLGAWDHRLMGGTKGHISYRNKKQLSEMIENAGFKELNWDFSVFCVAGNSKLCTKGFSGWLIQKFHNLKVRFWHSLFAFNYIVVAKKP